MTKRILTSAALLFPLLAPADTLLLRNGNRFRGTFNTANSSQITFTEYNGNRQSVNTADVQELQFGNDNGSGGDRNFGRGENRGFGDQPNRNNDRAPGLQPGSSAMVDDLDRLQADLQSAMNNNNLPSDQRQSLEDSRAVLRTAAQQSRAGRAINQRNLRLALDSIRNSSGGMQRQDRDVLNEDIRRVSASAGAPSVNGGRDY